MKNTENKSTLEMQKRSFQIKKKNGLSEHLSLTYCYIIWQNKGTKETAHERKEK